MTPYQLREAAKSFGISYPAAVRIRRRYLISQIDQGIDWILEEGRNNMPQVMLNEALGEILSLVDSLKVSVHTTITPDMVERAKSTKIDSMVEFIRGKARCISPEHEDKIASAFYGTRTNTLVCPVCDKKWDAIAVHRQLTGQSFPEAVKSLCG